MWGVVIAVLCTAIVLVLLLLYKSKDLTDGVFYTLTGAFVGSIIALARSRLKHSDLQGRAKHVTGGSTDIHNGKTQEQILEEIRKEIIEALRSKNKV